MLGHLPICKLQILCMAGRLKSVMQCSGKVSAPGGANNFLYLPRRKILIPIHTSSDPNEASANWPYKLLFTTFVSLDFSFSTPIPQHMLLSMQIEPCTSVGLPQVHSKGE